jgi:hypothetical protein
MLGAVCVACDNERILTLVARTCAGNSPTAPAPTTQSAAFYSSKAEATIGAPIVASGKRF